MRSVAQMACFLEAERSSDIQARVTFQSMVGGILIDDENYHCMNGTGAS